MALDSFTSEPYQRHNRRRQEHLASLGLDIAGRRVLEIGAGIGDHTGFFVDRGCRVTSTDGRQDCLDMLASRFPGVRTVLFDANGEQPPGLEPHEIVYAYGLLYHLRSPETALAVMGRLCTDMLLLETCVSGGTESRLVMADEVMGDPTQALDGLGCRPTRRWVWDRLNELFPHVYATVTQPWHEQFPVDWTAPDVGGSGLIRAIFVASRRPIDNPLLSSTLPDRQSRGG
ncbi:class I SAM-dependent methyltransferase [Azospirillum himalayense]|uniref:Class I SAM-dependent methyltransferase n=1 Tax=Azospirillum himalayense TaxID=654847 RepID=A0ABW0FZP2_9PROT